MERYVSPPGESRGRRRRHTRHLRRASSLGGRASFLGAGPRVRPHVPAHANGAHSTAAPSLLCGWFQKGAHVGGITAWGSPSAAL